jgi:hypothetical protein
MPANALRLIPVILVVGLSAPARASYQESSFWYWLVAASPLAVYYADLKSIKRPGELPNDDFWHISIMGPSGIKTRYSFDCIVQHYFPNGDPPSKAVPVTGIVKAAHDLSCAPPSMVNNLMHGKGPL